MSRVSPVTFTGNVTHKPDAKSRVSVPAGWRAAHGAVLSLIESHREQYPVVKCYTQEGFEELLTDVRTQAAAHGATPGQIDQYIGSIAGCSFEAEVSTQGKLLIPKAQRERLKLTDAVVLVGRGAYFELWNPADYAAANSPEQLAANSLDKLFNILS